MVKDINLDDLKILTEDKESYIKQAGIPEKNLFTADNANEIKNKHNALVKYATGFPTEEQKDEMLEKAIDKIKDEIDKGIIISIEDGLKLCGYNEFSVENYYKTILNGYEDSNYHYIVERVYDLYENRMIKKEYQVIAYNDNSTMKFRLTPLNNEYVKLFWNSSYITNETGRHGTGYQIDYSSFKEYELLFKRQDVEYGNDTKYSFLYDWTPSSGYDKPDRLPKYIKFLRIKKESEIVN